MGFDSDTFSETKMIETYEKFEVWTKKEEKKKKSFSAHPLRGRQKCGKMQHRVRECNQNLQGQVIAITIQ